MKTIEIQKSFENNVTVIVNGEKHIIHCEPLQIQVPDDNLFDVQLNYYWHKSSVIQFEPKDNIVLQISKNMRVFNRIIILTVLLALLLGIGGLFGDVIYILLILLSFIVIHQSIKYIKNMYIIREVIIENNL